MGERPWLARNRKGKKRLSSVKPLDISANPTELLEHIYQYQGNIHRRYDVFLSHSSYDTKQLLKLKQQLNEKGLVVYIDWVNDSVMMDRKNQNEDTWNVLKMRMDESEKMLFVMTDNSLRSEWTPKEIDYFKSLNREVVVYQPEEITEKPFEALAGCRKCSVGENEKIDM
ncbi:MAG: TIR domain-containing protein [Bacteroidaceae bacterium]